MLPIVVLLSSNGSNLQAIIDAIANKKLDANIRAVISDRKGAYGLERAKKAHIPTEILSIQQFPDRENYDKALAALVMRYQPALIVMAGFMRILSPDFLDQFPEKIINIHPSLLPNYPGLHTHEKIIAAKDPTHGCTIHFVTADLDAGPIIAQAHLSVLENDTVTTLKERIHKLEHLLYPLVIQWFAQKKIAMTREGICFEQEILPIQGKEFTYETLQQAWQLQEKIC